MSQTLLTLVILAGAGYKISIRKFDFSPLPFLDIKNLGLIYMYDSCIYFLRRIFIMKKAFEPLFETLKLPNGLELRNRFVLAPLTHESSNDDGTINDDVITYMAQRSSDVSLALTAPVMLQT